MVKSNTVGMRGRKPIVSAEDIAATKSATSMSMGKVEKFDLKQISAIATRHPLHTRMLAIVPGEAFTVEGVERTNITSWASLLKRREKRQFSIRKLGVLKYRVIRIK